MLNKRVSEAFIVNVFQHLSPRGTKMSTRRVHHKCNRDAPFKFRLAFWEIDDGAVHFILFIMNVEIYMYCH